MPIAESNRSLRSKREVSKTMSIEGGLMAADLNDELAQIIDLTITNSPGKLSAVGREA